MAGRGSVSFRIYLGEGDGSIDAPYVRRPGFRSPGRVCQPARVGPGQRVRVEWERGRRLVPRAAWWACRCDHRRDFGDLLGERQHGHDPDRQGPPGGRSQPSSRPVRFAARPVRIDRGCGPDEPASPRAGPCCATSLGFVQPQRACRLSDQTRLLLEARSRPPGRDPPRPRRSVPAAPLASAAEQAPPSAP